MERGSQGSVVCTQGLDFREFLHGPYVRCTERILVGSYRIAQGERPSDNRTIPAGNSKLRCPKIETTLGPGKREAFPLVRIRAVACSR